MTHKNIAMLRLLLDTEARLDDPLTPMYGPILIVAAQDGNKEITQLLAQYGALEPTQEQQQSLSPEARASLAHAQQHAQACAQTARDCLLALETSRGLPRDLSRLIWQTAGQRQEYMLPAEGSHY